jgi:hypothetical protein
MLDCQVVFREFFENGLGIHFDFLSAIGYVREFVITCIACPVGSRL